jgi:hypothetical protein
MASSIQQTSDGGFIVAGSSNSTNGDVSGNHGGYDYWIVKLDSHAFIEWQKSLGGSNDDYATSIHQTTDGGFIVAGYSNSNDGDVSGNQGDYDYWIVKLGAAGNIEWRKCLGGSGNDQAYSIQQISDSAYIVGGSSSSSDEDVSGNHGGKDYWIVKLQTIPGGTEILNGLDDNCNGSIDEGLTGINSITNSTPALSVFPNPTNGNFTIELKVNNQISDRATIEVINMLGQIVLSQNAELDKGKLQQEINLANVASGVYLVQVIANNKVYTKQISLQK